MAMTVAGQYRELSERLLDNETWGTLSPDEEDVMRDTMDTLWWQMSEQERAEQDAWLEQRRLHAPLSLGLEDLPPGAANAQGYRKPAA